MNAHKNDLPDAPPPIDKCFVCGATINKSQSLRLCAKCQRNAKGLLALKIKNPLVRRELEKC